MPSLFAIDVAEFHKAPAVLEKLQGHDIIPSLIPPGCNGLVQPLDLSINKPFKGVLRELTDEAIDERPVEEDTWTVAEGRVLTTKCVVQGWDDLCSNHRQIFIDSFWHVGLSLPTDGSCDHELNIKGFGPVEIGDWRWPEDQDEFREIPVNNHESEAVEYLRPWEEI